MEPAIEVRSLSKMYKLYARPASIVMEQLRRRPMHEAVWALRDVDFEVERGEVVGVVGANGAGKSTLLSILAGVLDPTSGSSVVRGDLRAILQLGTGFQDGYSGLENVYMGGYCLGYSKPEIDASLDWIVDFSGLGPVIEHPFRTYSSGMKARLTFAVTFCRRPEILIVDEALAAGDLAFQQKCVNRILELCSDGASALVVSHSMFFIEKLCSRALYLEDGRLVADDECRRVTRLYERRLLKEFAQAEPGTAATVATNSGGGTDSAPVSAGSAGHADPTGAGASKVAAAAAEIDPVDPAVQRLLDDPESTCPPILHLGLVRLLETRVLDRSGRPEDVFHTGDAVAVEIEVDSQVAKQDIAVGVQIFHESGVHVATTTNHVQLDEAGAPRRQRLDLARGRQVFRVEFPQLFLADGKYSLSVGMNPKEKHFTEADQLMRERRVATFGFFRADTPWKVIYDPPSRWTRSGGN